MIDVESYTCAVCNAPVKVEGIADPKITWSCGHDGNTVHANLRGRVFMAAMVADKMLTIDEIPERHRDVFRVALAHKAHTAPDGTKRWPYSEWLAYIDGYHKGRAMVEARHAVPVRTLSEAPGGAV